MTALLLCVACSDGGADKVGGGTDTTTTTTATTAGTTLVFSGQGNDLAVYSARAPYTKQVVIHHNDDRHPHGLDIDGHICFDPTDPDRFVAGERTHAETTGRPGWGVFTITDPTVGHLKVKEVGKLVPTYQPADPTPQDFGCGFLADGRILTTDVGNQSTGPDDGQLIVWFPPFESRAVRSCKVDVHLATGEGLLVDGDSVYVAQSRPPHSGVYRYAVADLPTSNTPAGGCDGKDATGAPFATHVTTSVFIAPTTQNGIATPAGLAMGPNGHLYVASLYNGVISEFTADGTFVRTILQPPPGETLGAKPLATGTPLDVGIGPDGSVYYADSGVVTTSQYPTGSIGPGTDTGTVRRITFDASGKPQPPVTIDRGLSAPDGIGIWQAPAS